MGKCAVCLKGKGGDLLLQEAVQDLQAASVSAVVDDTLQCFGVLLAAVQGLLLGRSGVGNASAQHLQVRGKPFGPGS